MTLEQIVGLGRSTLEMALLLSAPLLGVGGRESTAEHRAGSDFVAGEHAVRRAQTGGGGGGGVPAAPVDAAEDGRIYAADVFRFQALCPLNGTRPMNGLHARVFLGTRARLRHAGRRTGIDVDDLCPVLQPRGSAGPGQGGNHIGPDDAAVSGLRSDAAARNYGTIPCKNCRRRGTGRPLVGIERAVRV